MAYSLTLTKGERRAIDWIGGRYEHGEDFYRLLSDVMPEDAEWDEGEDITFTIPEYKAWEIKDLLNDSLFDCFAPSLVEKIRRFLDRIV